MWNNLIRCMDDGAMDANLLAACSMLKVSPRRHSVLSYRARDISTPERCVAGIGCQWDQMPDCCFAPSSFMPHDVIVMCV